MTEHRIFCGGTFCFDYWKEEYKVTTTRDYRTIILGSVEALLHPNGTNGVKISQHVVYIGPFYFEVANMEAEEIIKCEKQMIESCTDAVFVLDDASCPGSITEIMYANALKKPLRIFYVHYGRSVETESGLHTPCWYPLLLDVRFRHCMFKCQRNRFHGLL